MMSNSISTDHGVRLGGWDHATWRAATADPMFRAPLVALLRLGADPGLAELLERVSRAVPGSLLSRRIDVIDGHPHAVSVEVDIQRHVIDWEGAGEPLTGLANGAADLIPADAPPWCIVRFPGEPAHLALVMHHAIADGRTALRMAGALLDGWSPPIYPEPSAYNRPDHVGGLRANTVDLFALGRSVLRLTQVHGQPLSLLMTGRGPRHSWHALEFPFGNLRTQARAAGVTVNDALVAAVLRATSTYHQVHDHAVERLRVNVPISLRARDATRGNALAVARTTLPIPTSGEIMHEIHEELLTWRTEPALAQIDRLVGASNLIPVSILAAVARSSDLTISNLGPVQGQARIAGQPVEAVFPLPGTMGVAVSVALLSFGGLGCLGVAIDDSAVPDAELYLSILAVEVGAVIDRRGAGMLAPEPA